MERKEMIHDNAKFFLDKNLAVHITLDDGVWFNGNIIELNKDRLILQEDKLGLMPIHFERIKDDGIREREIR